MVSEAAEIIKQIRILMGVQLKKKIEIAMLKRKIAGCELSIDRVEESICSLEERLWWARFADYCNTPCWRFKP